MPQIGPARDNLCIAPGPGPEYIPTMRRLVLVVVAALAFGASAGDAGAQPSPYGIGDERAAPAPAGPAIAPAPGTYDPTPVMPWAQPPAEGSHMRAPVALTNRPSGFWTSNRPATHGAYRWRIMAVAGVVLALTTFFVLRLLVRTSREGRAESLPAAWARRTR